MGCFCHAGIIVCEGDDVHVHDVAPSACPQPHTVVANAACTSNAPLCSSERACGAAFDASGQCDCIGGTWSCTPDVPCDIDGGEGDDAGEAGDAATDAGDAD